MQRATERAPFTIRVAAPADAAPLLQIYRPFVEDTAVSFETSVPTVEEFAARIEKSLGRWQWLVAERGGICIGYAYGSSHRERAAYRWSVEVSAYVHANHRRRGIGRALYLALFESLAARGYCNAYAGITLPNEASVALHESVGFERVGVFTAVGWKFDRWHDVAWFQRKLRDKPPAEPRLRLATRDDIRAMHRIRLAVTENTLTSGDIAEADYLSAIELTGCGWVVETEAAWWRSPLETRRRAISGRCSSIPRTSALAMADAYTTRWWPACSRRVSTVSGSRPI